MKLFSKIRSWFQNLFTTKVNKVKDTSIIREFEGLKLRAYYDPVGVLTIGYGHTTHVRVGQTITEKEAEELLKFDLRWVEKELNNNVKVPLKQNQYDALASFIYNVGGTAFRSSTLLKKLNAGDYQGAADELPRWNKAGGRVLRGLTRRRNAERAYFLK